MKKSNLKINGKISLKMDRKNISLDQYAGKWVAFLGNKIVGNSKTLKGLMKKMRKRGLEKKVSVFAVPPKGYLII